MPKQNENPKKYAKNPVGECLLFSSGGLFMASILVNPLFATAALATGIAGLCTYNEIEIEIVEPEKKPLLFQGLRPPVIRVERVEVKVEEKKCLNRKN